MVPRNAVGNVIDLVCLINKSPVKENAPMVGTRSNSLFFSSAGLFLKKKIR